MVDVAQDWEVSHERLDGRVTNLEASFATHTKDQEARWSENRETHKDLYTRTDRPPWSVTFVLGGLMSAVVGLSVYLLTH